MKSRLLVGLKKNASAIMKRRRRKDTVVNKPSRSRRPGRLFQ